MRAAAVLALVGASTSTLATVHAEQPHKAGAIAAAAHHDAGGIFFEMEATTDLEVEATSDSLVVSESTPEQEAPWTGIDTTVTVEVPASNTNATNTHATPLPTEEANPTDAEPTEVTGGALPQPMKASAAGLLGFFIMSLVML